MASNDCWIYQMAGSLTCEIIEVMAGIKLMKLPQPGAFESKMDSVYGLISGKYDVHLTFEADPGLFTRMARNMIGAEPADKFEVREYASEIFNVLCGRIVSELCRASNTALCFSPIVYQVYSETEEPKHKDDIGALYFKSDRNEFARLSWSREPVENLLRGKV